MNNFSPDFVGVESGHRNNVVIGCGSPDKARGKSRNTARYAAFSILATRYGGSDGMAYAMPVTLCVPPVFHTHSSCRPMWKWIGSCSKAQLDSSMSTNLHKVCKKCGGTEFYANGKCKACVKKYSATRYAANPEKSKAVTAKWRLENKDRLKEYDAAWKANHPAQVKQQQARYRVKHREKHIARAAAWSQANPGKVKARSAKWHQANPERARALMVKFHIANPGASTAYRQNRRARKNASGGKLSSGLSVKLLKLQRGKCACCGKPLGNRFHLDHIMPLALGGANVDWNIQLLHATCNQRKHAKHPIAFMQERGFLL